MHTTIRRIGIIAASTVLAGALVAGEAIAASAYPDGDLTMSISTTVPKASSGAYVSLHNANPGSRVHVVSVGKNYYASADENGDTPGVRFATPALAGTYTVAGWGYATVGGTSVKQVQRRSYTVGTKLSSISISSTSTPAANKSFTVSGAINLKKSGAVVYISYRTKSNGDAYKLITTATTNTAGQFSKAIKIPAKGNYFLKVTVKRDANFTSVAKYKTIAVH